MTFHDYFRHNLFKFSITFGLAVTFENFQIFLVLVIFFLPQTVQQTQTLVSTKIRPVHAVKLLLLILSCLWYALSSAITNLPNRTYIFHDFLGPTIKFYDMTFQVFHDLYKPCPRSGPTPVYQDLSTCHDWLRL